jgi:Outer membrane protein beta-barrel domain
MAKYVVTLLIMVVGLSFAVAAQENRSEISVKGGGMFPMSTSGNGTSYSATESGGVLGTYRYHLNHWISLEGAYGYNMNTQKYALSSSAFRIQSGIHQFTGNVVLNLPSRHHSRLNPYVLVGGGALLFEPTNNQFNTISQTQSQTRACSRMERDSIMAFIRHCHCGRSIEGWCIARPTSDSARSLRIQ